jgi:hypothetical protein
MVKIGAEVVTRVSPFATVTLVETVICVPLLTVETVAAFVPVVESVNASPGNMYCVEATLITVPVVPPTAVVDCESVHPVAVEVMAVMTPPLIVGVSGMSGPDVQMKGAPVALRPLTYIQKFEFVGSQVPDEGVYPLPPEVMVKTSDPPDMETVAAACPVDPRFKPG